MSIWPTSERTALLWGHRWWLAGRAEPLDFENLSHAAEILAAHLASESHPVRLRLIYQPTTLTSIAAACPCGNRSALQQALGFEHPAMTNPAHAWSHEPILAQGAGYGAILHIEQEPGLFPLIERLARRGITVTTAWPLATYLHALPAEWSESGAVLVMATDAEQATAYHHPASGSRTIHKWHGESATADAANWLENEREKNPADPALLVTTSESEEATAGVRRIPLHEALACSVVLPRAHPAQFVPAAPFVTAQRAMVAASILLLLAGGWSGMTYAGQFKAWTDQQRSTGNEKAALRAEIAHYRVNSAEIVALRARLAGPGASPPVGEMLDSICQALPAQIALDRVHVEQGRFTLSGHVAPGASAQWDDWRGRIDSTRWTLEPTAVPRDTGAFTVNGVFTP